LVVWRLAAIGLAGGAVTSALSAAGRLGAPNYTFSLFGKTGLTAITLKSLPASVVLGLATVQVLLALWLYRKLPLADSRRGDSGRPCVVAVAPSVVRRAVDQARRDPDSA
jgi:hypothetical protein